MKCGYYKGFFKVHQVEIMAVNTNGWSKFYKERWKYTIKFKNGKFKNVSSRKLTFEFN